MKSNGFRKRTSSELIDYKYAVQNMNFSMDSTVGNTPTGLFGSDLPKNANEEFAEIENEKDEKYDPKPGYIRTKEYVSSHLYEIFISIIVCIMIPFMIDVSAKCAEYRVEVENIKEKISLIDVSAATKEQLSYEVRLLEDDFKMMIFTSKVDLQEKLDGLEKKLDEAILADKK